MIATLIAVLGLLLVAIGLLFIIGSCLPRFGGGTEPHALPIGVVLLGLGLWLIFKAGSFA